MPGAEVGHEIGDEERRGRVQRDDVADRARRPREDLVDDLGVPGGVATGERAVLGTRDAEVERVDVVDARPSPSRSSCTVDVVGDGELVEAVVAVEHERPLGAELGEHRDQALRHRRVGHADDLALDTRGVGERAERS